MKLGIEKTAMIRLRAGISYALTEAMDEGHCGLPTDQLIPLAEELLEAPKELILTALELEQSEGAVIADRVGDTACTFLAGLYRAEQAIADRLIRVVNGRLPWAWIDEAKAVPWVEKQSGLQLADSQRAAIRLALKVKALVITGGPGVGKTTIVNSILKMSQLTVTHPSRQSRSHCARTIPRGSPHTGRATGMRPRAPSRRGWRRRPAMDLAWPSSPASRACATIRPPPIGMVRGASIRKTPRPDLLTSVDCQTAPEVCTRAL